MEKQDVIEFFDRCAATWDAEMIKSDEIIEVILDHAEVGAGMDVLDVACGTGVMFPYYLQREVASVTGIDIAPEMAKIAQEKFRKEPGVQVICGDVEEASFDRQFDRIVVYNAFPHFPEPRRLIKQLSRLLKDGGRLTIAHGASRTAIDNHHSGAASKVSNGLMPAESLAKLFEPYFEVEIQISNNRMYQVSGVKRGDTPQRDTQEQATMEELLAVLGYMVSHNDAHAQEVAELAERLLDTGRRRAYDRLMDAVSDFDVANAKLDAVLKELQAE